MRHLYGWICREKLQSRVLVKGQEQGMKSFRVCGITVNPDGSEDSEISCLKENGVAYDARCKIELETAVFEQGEQVESGDPFADEEDEDELEENEIVVHED